MFSISRRLLFILLGVVSLVMFNGAITRTTGSSKCISGSIGYHLCKANNVYKR